MKNSKSRKQTIKPEQNFSKNSNNNRQTVNIGQHHADVQRRLAHVIQGIVKLMCCLFFVCRSFFLRFWAPLRITGAGLPQCMSPSLPTHSCLAIRLLTLDSGLVSLVQVLLYTARGPKHNMFQSEGPALSPRPASTAPQVKPQLLLHTSRWSG